MEGVTIFIFPFFSGYSRKGSRVCQFANIKINDLPLAEDRVVSVPGGVHRLI